MKRVILNSKNPNYSKFNLLSFIVYGISRTHVTLQGVDINDINRLVELSYEDVIIPHIQDMILEFMDSANLSDGHYWNCFIVNYCIFHDVKIEHFLPNSVISNHIKNRRYFK